MKIVFWELRRHRWRGSPAQNETKLRSENLRGREGLPMEGGQNDAGWEGSLLFSRFRCVRGYCCRLVNDHLEQCASGAANRRKLKRIVEPEASSCTKRDGVGPDTRSLRARK